MSPTPPGHICRDFGPTWKCRRHGDLPVDQFYHRHQPNRHGNGLKCRLACIRCASEQRAKQYRADPDSSKAGLRAWRQANPERWRELVRSSWQANKGKYLAKAKATRDSLRMEALSRYADPVRCTLCPQESARLLVIDHIDGGGNQHRSGEKCHGSGVFSWLKKNGYPPGFRVLCHNCNFRESLRLRRASLVERGSADVASLRLKAERKHSCLVAYGGRHPVCACCNESDLDVLSIDHLDGGGRQHRKETGDGSNFYQWLIRSRFPDGYRVLCLNCNFTLGLGQECSH